MEMEVKLDKKYLDEAVQSAVADIKKNFIQRSVLDDIKAEIMKWCAPYTYYNHKVIDKKEVFDIIDRCIKRAEDVAE
jgi:hypothetical protein